MLANAIVNILNQIRYSFGIIFVYTTTKIKKKLQKTTYEGKTPANIYTKIQQIVYHLFIYSYTYYIIFMYRYNVLFLILLAFSRFWAFLPFSLPFDMNFARTNTKLCYPRNALICFSHIILVLVLEKKRISSVIDLLSQKNK